MSHFVLTSADLEREVEIHEAVLGLERIDEKPVDALGGSATRISFGADGEAFLVAVCPGAHARPGRLGSNCPKAANLSVPAGSLPYWERRLFDAHFECERATRFGADRLEFSRADGIGYSLVEDGDAAPRSAAAEVPAEFAIKGLHSVTISLMDVRETHDFLIEIFDAECSEQELAWGRYRFSADQERGFVELLHEPYRAPGTWKYATGTPHHLGIDVGGPEERAELCARLVAAGYLDVSSPSQDDGESSVWVRAAGGILIDLHSLGRPTDGSGEAAWVME